MIIARYFRFLVSQISLSTTRWSCFNQVGPRLHICTIVLQFNCNTNKIQQLLIIQQHSLLLANEWDEILATTKYVQRTMTEMENLGRCWPSPSSTGLSPSWAALTLPQTSPSPRCKSDSSKKCLAMIMIIIGRLFPLWPRPILWQGSQQSQQSQYGLESTRTIFCSACW